MSERGRRGGRALPLQTKRRSRSCHGAETQTVHFSAPDVFVSDGRCDVPEGTLIVQETEGQMTTIVGPGGTLHREAVFHGTITIAFGGQTYEGHFADHGVSADNQSNEVAVFASKNLQRAADGALLNVHLLIHISISATGEPNLFVQLNCGAETLFALDAGERPPLHRRGEPARGLDPGDLSRNEGVPGSGRGWALQNSPRFDPSMRLVPEATAALTLL